jgi:hypothetical protein
MSGSLGNRVAQRADDRLLKQFRISKQMRPFVNRMRMRSKDLDLTDPARASEFDRCSEIMKTILAKKRISRNDADRILALTFDAAADHQLERLRRDRFLHDLERSKKNLQRLIKHIERLAQAIAELPPISKGKLNKIIGNQNWRHFDTEMFSELMQAMQDALSILSPACAANKARSVIRETLRASGDRAVTQIFRTAPPAITELWESIPAHTRTYVEAEIRRWTAPKRGQVIALVNHLVGLLKKYRPIMETRRPPAIEGRYLRNVAEIWVGFGLNVGRAHDGAHGKSVESPFQRFARVALAACGDNSPISDRQIANLKSASQRRRNRHPK